MVILDAFGLMPDDCSALSTPEKPTMIDNLGALLLGIIIGAVASVGMLIWWDGRKDDDAAEDASDQQAQRGGGGPTKPAVPK